MRIRLYKGSFFFALLCVASLLVAGSALADRAERVKIDPPRTALDRLSIFSKSFSTKNIVEIVDLSDKPKAKKVRTDKLAKNPNAEVSTESKQSVTKTNLRFVSQNPGADPVLPPEETPSVRVNPDAPSSIKAMISANRSGDRQLAVSYAEQFVRYQQNFFFEVRDIVGLVGEALIRQNVIEEEEWVGVGQMIDYELAKTRYEVGAVLKPTHEMAMQRIKPDKSNKAKIYYFFTLKCSWCRYMAADIERLWRLSQTDSRVEFTALAMGETNTEWLKEYMDYAEWSMPVYEGTDLAKEWSIGFVPALIVVAPSGNKAYMKTGQQSFERMYEFVRTVQGLPATVTEDFKRLASTPIGKAEKLNESSKTVMRGNSAKRGMAVARPPKKRDVEIQRF